ncbi:50S ribosomal protein L29 [Lactiplantibacillus plantarum]|nr:50S ribosomal protein L29 [Lactiplantibacillus plantarum]
MKAKEIKALSTTEMLEKEKSYKDELFNLRFQLATGQLENTARLKMANRKFNLISLENLSCFDFSSTKVSSVGAILLVALSHLFMWMV